MITGAFDWPAREMLYGIQRGALADWQILNSMEIGGCQWAELWVLCVCPTYALALPV